MLLQRILLMKEGSATILPKLVNLVGNMRDG